MPRLFIHNRKHRSSREICVSSVIIPAREIFLLSIDKPFLQEINSSLRLPTCNYSYIPTNFLSLKFWNSNNPKCNCLKLRHQNHCPSRWFTILLKTSINLNQNVAIESSRAELFIILLFFSPTFYGVDLSKNRMEACTWSYIHLLWSCRRWIYKVTLAMKVSLTAMCTWKKVQRKQHFENSALTC